MRTLPARLVAPLLAVLLVAGCGGTDEPEPSAESAETTESAESTESPSEAPSVDPAGSEEYDELVALRDAAIAAGYECEAWVNDDRIPYAAESGACNDEDVFSRYEDPESLDLQVRTLERFVEESAIEPGSSLIGANWTITSDPALIEEIQTELGGTITN